MTCLHFDRVPVESIVEPEDVLAQLCLDCGEQLGVTFTPADVMHQPRFLWTIANMAPPTTSELRADHPLVNIRFERGSRTQKDPRQSED